MGVDSTQHWLDPGRLSASRALAVVPSVAHLSVGTLSPSRPETLSSPRLACSRLCGLEKALGWAPLQVVSQTGRNGTLSARAEDVLNREGTGAGRAWGPGPHPACKSAQPTVECAALNASLHNEGYFELRHLPRLGLAGLAEGPGRASCRPRWGWN